MQKRIYASCLMLILFCVLLLALSFSLLFWNAARSHEMAAIRSMAFLMAELLNQGAEVLPAENARITIISPEGIVLSDSHAAAEQMGSRADRQEFVEALQNGRGEAIRVSGVLDTATFYYAIRLKNGEVLRLSRSLNSLAAIFTSILPLLAVVTMLILILAYIMAGTLTRKIIEPLADINLEISESYDEQADKDLYEELLPFLRKITRQKHEIEQQILLLKHRADTTSAITANMQEGLILLDQKGMILAANNSVLNIFNISQESEVLQKNVLHIYRDIEFSQAVADCLKGAHLQMTLLRDEKIYNIHLNPVYIDGICQGAIIFFINKTEQHRAENLRREFSANVSHELKTPLTTISALSEMMANGMVKDGDFVSFASKIKKQTQRLIDIIEDIIRLSQFDENKFEQEFSDFDVYELAESVIAELKGKAKNVKLELLGAPLRLIANKLLIDELLYNLIDNGIKYNKEGGHVTVAVQEEGDYCKITVSDSGIGIPEEQQKRVFERFYRVDSSRSKKTGGTGLGLSIVKHIAEHHNGRLSLESVEGEGTTIVCYIKRQAPKQKTKDQ